MSNQHSRPATTFRRWSIVLRSAGGELKERLNILINDTVDVISGKTDVVIRNGDVGSLFEPIETLMHEIMAQENEHEQRCCLVRSHMCFAFFPYFATIDIHYYFTLNTKLGYSLVTICV